SDLSGHGDHLAHTEAFAVSKVVDELIPGGQRFESKKVCTCQVLHMNVVPDAGAIRRWIVGAEDGDGFPLSGSHLKDKRNQVRFRIMSLAQWSGRAGCVEVSETGVAQTMDAMKPFQHLLHQQLGLAVNISWPERILFANGNALRVSIKSGS